MKKIIIISLFIVSAYCSAQNPILNIHTSMPDIANAYYKDIENFQNQFVGTWVYSDAVKTIRFKFIKKEMFYYQGFSKNYYEDYLVGEMQYIESNVEKINSLSNLDVNHTSIFNYNLFGAIKVDSDWYPRCITCPSNVQRIAMSYKEPTTDDIGLSAAFVMRREDENGVQKIKIQYILTNGPLGVKVDFETPSTTTNFTIPYGDYTLVKEN